MFVLGITGPSGAGKGTACGILEKYGFYHIDTDRLVPDLYPEALPLLTNAFGEGIQKNGAVVKKELAKAAFASPQATQKLNSILHPLVMKKVSELISEAKKNGFSGVTVDGAALYEAHAETVCDKILCILAPKDVRLERVIGRDGISQSAALLRFDAQKEDSYYAERADAVIENRDLTQLEQELKLQLKEWKI